MLFRPRGKRVYVGLQYDYSVRQQAQLSEWLGCGCLVSLQLTCPARTCSIAMEHMMWVSIPLEP
jgi:hypothetical protein